MSIGTVNKRRAMVGLSKLAILPPVADGAFNLSDRRQMAGLSRLDAGPAPDLGPAAGPRMIVAAESRRMTIRRGMKQMETRTKDPSAVLDYSSDWLRWLGADTIAASTWSLRGPSLDANDLEIMTNPAPSATGTVATCWLDKGVAGSVYFLTNRIVTAGGRTDERTMKIICEDK